MTDLGHLRRLALVPVVALLAAGCGAGSDPAPEDPDGAAVDGFPVTVQNCGRELTFDEPPSRVVTSFLPTLETLIELGVGDRVIGRTASADQLGVAGFLPGHEELYDAIPEVSDGYRPPPKEELLALAPDFVFGMSFNDFNPETGFATVEELEEAGIPVYIASGWCTVEGANNYEIQSTLDDLRNLGKIFGVEQRGADLAAGIEQRLADVDARVSGLEPLTVVAADASAEIFYAMGLGMGNDVIERAGGRNVFAEVGEYAEVSVEEVAAADAQAYLVIDYEPATPEERIAVIEAVAPGSVGVQEQRYAVVPGVAIHPGVRVVDAIEALAKVLHPDAFEA